MNGIKSLMDALPKEQYVQGGDVKRTDILDGFGGHLTGLRYLGGKNFGEAFLGACKFFLSWGRFYTKPLVSLMKPLINPIGTICKHVTKLIHANTRRDLFPPWRDANDLSANERREFARDAKLCACSSSGWGIPRLKNKTQVHRSDLPQDYVEQRERELGVENLTYFEIGEYDLPNRCALIGGDTMSNPQNERTEAEDIFNRLPPNLKANIQRHKGAFIDRNTGLVMNFVLDKNVPEGAKPKIHIIFPGTGSGGGKHKNLGLEHLATDFSMSGLTSDVPQSFRQATQVVKLMKEQLGGDYDLEVKGFSMGGAFAAFTGIDNDLKTTTLGPAPLSPNLQKELTDEKMLNAVRNNRIMNLNVRGCWLTDRGALPVMGKIADAFEKGFGKTAPHAIGPGYTVMQEYNDDTVREIGKHNASDHIWELFSQSRTNEES